MVNPALALISDYPFDRLRALLGASEPPAGLAPIVLSVGEPRHRPPPLVQEVIAATADGWGRYPPIDGTPEFRAAVVDWLNRRFRLPSTMLDPDRHLLPIAGSREALYLIAQVVVPRRIGRQRPAVLMPNPFYQVYYAAAAMSGAEPVLLPATADNGFLPDLAELPPSLLERTALLYLCSPANPQGSVADLRFLQQAVALARQYRLVVVVDECYAEIYDRQAPPGVLEACAALDGACDNVLAFHSLSKRSSVPGLRSGFVAGDQRLISDFKRLRAFGGASLPLPVLAASTALWRDEDHVAANRDLYRAKLDLAERLLAGRFGFYRPHGGFFLWLDVEDGERAAAVLWADAALRVLPGAYLARADSSGRNPGRPFIRLALIEDLRTTEEALRRLLAAL